MDGYETTKAMRQMGFHRPIIAVTASASPEDRKRCIQSGMNDVLCKPFTREQVLQLLSQLPNPRE
jgi:two-component system, sensor histidine kinase